MESNNKVNTFTTDILKKVKEIASLPSLPHALKIIRNAFGIFVMMNISGCVSGKMIIEEQEDQTELQSVKIIAPQVATLRCEYLNIMVETPQNTKGCLKVYTEPPLKMDLYLPQEVDTLVQLEMPQEEKALAREGEESFFRHHVYVNILDNKKVDNKKQNSRTFKYIPDEIEMPEKFIIYAEYLTYGGDLMKDSIIINTFDCGDIDMRVECSEEENVLHCQYNVGNYTPIDMQHLIISSTFNIEGASVDSVIVKNSTFDDYSTTKYSSNNEELNENGNNIFVIQEQASIQLVESGETYTADVYYYTDPTQKKVVCEKNAYIYLLSNEFHDHFQWDFEQYNPQLDDFERTKVCEYNISNFTDCTVMLASITGEVVYQGNHAGLENINLTDGNYEIQYTCADSQPSGKVIVRGGQVTNTPCSE